MLKRNNLTFNEVYERLKNIWELMTPSEKCECLLDQFNDGCEFYDFELVAFYFKEKNIWVAIDNRDGNCWVEDFKTKRAARKWCK